MIIKKEFLKYLRQNNNMLINGELDFYMNLTKYRRMGRESEFVRAPIM